MRYWKILAFAAVLIAQNAEAQQLIKQSESTAARRTRWVYLVDVTDGYTPETAIAIASNNDSDCADATDECCISKNGGTPVYCAGTLTHVGNGAYIYEYTSGEVDTLGAVSIRINDSAARQFVGTDQVVGFDVFSSAPNVNVFSASNDALEKSDFAADGTAQAGTASTIQLASAETYGDSGIVGRQVCLTSGTGLGQCRRVSGYVGATDTATVSRNWTTTPDNTSKYVVSVMAEDFDAAGAELTSCPSATASFRDQIMLAYMIARNKITQSATEWKLYRNDGSTVLCTKTVTPGATFTLGAGS